MPSEIYEDTYIDVSEDVETPFDRSSVRVFWQTGSPINVNSYFSEYRELRQLEKISKIFDEKQKEVFKKCDLLKALND